MLVVEIRSVLLSVLRSMMWALQQRGREWRLEPAIPTHEACKLVKSLSNVGSI